MEEARHGESCRLLLVGLVPASLAHVTHIGAVALERKNLDPTGLLREAAQLLAVFLEAEGIHAGTGQQREMIVHALVSKLQHFATKSAPLSREEFVKLLREWVSSAPKDGKSIDLSHFDVSKYAPAELVGREKETKLLSDAWNQAILGEKGRPRILTFVALGGEGKTSLVAKWAAELAHQDWPGCDAAFAWSFYSQGTREQAAASSDLFLKEALTFFGDEAMAGSAAGAFEKGRRLASLSVSGGRCSSSTDWSRCNTRLPRPRRANSRTRASPRCSRAWPPPATACASSPPVFAAGLCGRSGRPLRQR